MKKLLIAVIILGGLLLVAGQAQASPLFCPGTSVVETSAANECETIPGKAITQKHCSVKTISYRFRRICKWKKGHRYCKYVRVPTRTKKICHTVVIPGEPKESCKMVIYTRCVEPFNETEKN